MLPNLIFGLLLIGISGGLWWRQVRAFRCAQAEGLSERDLHFARRQYRRRLKVSILITVIGVAIIGGAFMTHPLLSLAYWSSVLLLLFWIAILALADLSATHAHFRALSNEYAAEHSALQAELARHRKHDKSGDSASNGVP